MSNGSLHTILLFMYFIMQYIFQFLPRSDDEPAEEEKKAPEEQLFSRVFPAF